MTEASVVFPKAFAVWFEDIEADGDTASFHRITWHWSRQVIETIGSVIATAEGASRQSRL